MGVHGLWKLIEPSGQMVPLESLAGKVLAVDVSIWLHQAVKGMHDASDAPVAVAHLLILFHRICKLLFYKIKPVFVFDGGVPALKHQTMAARRQHAGTAKNEAMKVREKLIKNLLKHEAVRQVLSNETASAALGLNSFTLPGPSVEEDLYKLPPIAADYPNSEDSSEEISSNEEENERQIEDIHSIDVTSKEFLSLPPEIRHDILTELIDTRKQSSWKYLDNMPKKSDSFSDFQMNRLLKRHAVQTSLENAGKEMGGRALSLKELESMLGDQGVLDPKADLPSRRIAQDSVTRYMLIQNNLPSVSSISNKEDNTSKKFDIMERLEEVDWSSDSETDIILRKSSDLTSVVKDEKSVLKTDKNEVAQCHIKNESFSLSGHTKVRMTDEITKILSVLEDDDLDINYKMKIKDLQKRINECDKEKIEMKANENTKILINKGEDRKILGKGLSDPAELINESFEKKSELSLEIYQTSNLEKDKVVFDNNSGNCLNQNSESILEIQKKEDSNLFEEKNKSPIIIENFTNNEEFKKSDSSVPGEIVNLNETMLDEKEMITEKNEEVPTENQTIASVVLENQKQLLTKNVSDYSSDSESDLCPVLETESLCKSDPKTMPVTSEDIISDENNESKKSIIITVNPSSANDKDDIFADLFQSDAIKYQDIKQEAKEKRTDNEDDNKAENEDINIINEYKYQFQKEISKGDISDLKKVLEDQQQNLLKEQGKQERLALNPTDQMYSDAQELLRLFGIPFIIAPMEAEAQCATLNLIGLTEGTITDDSDIWLFGGRVVYKNFFNQNKHVLEYRAEDIQKYFKLSREDMIKIALLVGSDYTVGLNGIGPVTAMEILASFQTSNQDILDSLQRFRDWFTGRCKNGPTRATLKRKIRNTVISPGFPNKAVVEAYLNPEVDKSKEPFSWAKPNLDLIQKYAKLKMGWSSEKCSELLLPVLKKLEENSCQNIIEKYFKIVQKTSPTEGRLSKRVENAIKCLGGDLGEEIEKKSNSNRKRKPKRNFDGNEMSNEEKEEGKIKNVKKIKFEKNEVGTTSKIPVLDESSRTKLINQKLHQDLKIPQKELAQKLKDERKKKAAEIFRTFKKGGKKKLKVFAKEEVKLSESSSEGD